MPRPDGPAPAMVGGPQRWRERVQGFLDEERTAARFEPACDAWLYAADVEFSRRLATAGFVGMVIPSTYGGAGASHLDRLAVVEELLRAGAPVAAHWFADRQVAPALLRYGSEQQKQAFLPEIAAGRVLFAIGMSEAESGSDLASVRTKATRTRIGWRLHGTKTWTSGAHLATHLLVLARTGDGTSRHAGLSQFLVPLDSAGVEVRPIRSLTGEHHFNEVLLEDVALPEDAVLGTEGEGWQQITAELAFERSGPERFMSTLPLLSHWCAAWDGQDPHVPVAVGRLMSRLWVLRRASWQVALLLEAGGDAAIAAALVKDLGAQFEQDVVDVVRDRLTPTTRYEDSVLATLLDQAITRRPSATLRGGTTEILRSIVAKSLR